MTARAGGGRTIAEIVHHIAESGLIWRRADPPRRRLSAAVLRRPSRRDAGGMERPTGKAELVELLERTHRDGAIASDRPERPACWNRFGSSTASRPAASHGASWHRARGVPSWPTGSHRQAARSRAGTDEADTWRDLDVLTALNPR